MDGVEVVTSGREVAVVGAGIVGTCCALYLQREGFAVTLIDRAGPGQACSAGNAGGFGYASCIPAALPGILRALPRMLVDPASPLILRWRHLPRLLPWFSQFVRNANAAKVEDSADARAALTFQLFDAYAPLLAAAGVEDMVQRRGWLSVFESEKGFQAAQHGLELRQRRGIEIQVLDQTQVHEMEPALSPRVIRGVLMPQAGHTVNPLRLTQALAADFVAKGGRLMRQCVRGFEMTSDGPRALVTDEAPVRVDQIVIAAGAWSAALARQLGSPIPLAAERGYHVMMPSPRIQLRRPINSPERHVAISSMEHGLRVSGISEFAPPDAPPRKHAVDRLTDHAKALCPELSSQGMTTWMGARPSLPDSRPVIGRSPRHPNVFFAFGHDQIGLGTAAITGKLIGELATGRASSIDLSPYHPERF